MDLPPEATALLAVPPARFAAEREALARTLAARHDPAAAAVRKLRRPVGLAWVLNRLSRDHPREVRALLQAGDRLRAGQRRAVSGAGAAALREAETALREHARALRLAAEGLLAAEGRRGEPAALARIELLLRVAATGPAREDLAAGRLARDPDVGEAGLSGLTLLAGGAPARGPAAAPPEDAAAATGRPHPRPARGHRAAAPRDAAREARERKVRERETRRRAAADAREAARRKKEHDRAVAAAHAGAARARAGAEKAEQAAERAEQAAREARERAARARAEASRAAARALAVERGGT